MKRILYVIFALLSCSLTQTSIANDDHLLKLSEECRDYINQDSWVSGQAERCLAYRVHLTELNIGDAIQSKVDEHYDGYFTLFNGFVSHYEPKEKPFMSKVRHKDEVILTKIFPRHSICNLRAEIENGLSIWNMKIPNRDIETNFEFTFTDTKKFCGGSSLNYNGKIEYDSPETRTRTKLLQIIYD